MECMEIIEEDYLFNNRKSFSNILKRNCLKYNNLTIEEKIELLNSKKETINKKIDKPKEELIKELNYFINSEIDDLQVEGGLALDLCNEDDNYHIVSYWIDGTYKSVENFISNNYNELLIDVILEKYPNDLSLLECKIRKDYKNVSKKRIVIEALASILLNEFQHINEWYTVYGTEEVDMIDFNRYNIVNAYYDEDNFPIIKTEDIVAAMYGINVTVQPSDLYNIFAYYSEELKMNNEKSMFNLYEDEYIFTPDPFLVVGVEARWKNYVDLINNTKGNRCCIDYALKFNQLDQIEDYDIRNTSIIASAIEDYFNRYSKAPNSLPLLKDMIKVNYNNNCYEIIYSIRGVKNKKKLLG